MISQLYVSQISHVAEEIRPRAVVGEWSKQSPSAGRVVEEEHWSGGRGGSTQTLVEWSRRQYPSAGQVVKEDH
jgi:hypothetical protein